MTGATGFLGTHLVAALRAAGYRDLRPLSSRDYNLLEQAEVRRMMREQEPEVVVHLAALIGGIKANKDHPADFFYRNALMNVMVMHEARQSGVIKYMTCIGGCCYPAHAPSPIREECLWNGYPQPENAPYSVAKMIAVTQAAAFRQQYGFNAIVMVPGNLYGPNDNFNLNDAHVVAAVIRKVIEAQQRGEREIVAWGSGTPVRDFMFVKDAAAALVVALETYNEPGIVNISSGIQTTIRELYETVTGLCGFKGAIRWDTTKPDGQMFKGFDVTRMKTVLKFDRITPLRTGLAETIAWFKDNCGKPGAVRL